MEPPIIRWSIIGPPGVYNHEFIFPGSAFALPDERGVEVFCSVARKKDMFAFLLETRAREAIDEVFERKIIRVCHSLPNDRNADRHCASTPCLNRILSKGLIARITFHDGAFIGITRCSLPFLKLEQFIDTPSATHSFRLTDPKPS
jgi:hypothetical protein